MSPTEYCIVVVWLNFNFKENPVLAVNKVPTVSRENREEREKKVRVVSLVSPGKMVP